MEWDDLRYVLAAARSGSFLTAANLLKVSHTTVGRRIKALETSLGKPLFRRTRDGCFPTDACALLLPTAERMEDEMRRLTALPLKAPVEPEGCVRINTAAWIHEHLIIPSLPDFFARYPKVQLFIVGDVVEQKGEQETQAFSLRFDVMAKRTEIETAFAEIDYSVYAPPVDSKENLPWVTNRAGGISLKTFGWLEEQNVEPTDIKLFANDAELVHAAIAAGIGKGLIPDYLGQRSPDIVRLTTGEPVLKRTLRTLVPRRFAAASEVIVTLNWVRETIIRELEKHGFGRSVHSVK